MTYPKPYHLLALLPMAAMIGMTAAPALASVSVEANITGLEFQTTNINSALAGNATVSIVTTAPAPNYYTNFTGLAFAGDYRVDPMPGNSKVLLPGTSQSYGGTAADGWDATHTSLITEKFENSAAGWSLKSKAVSTPGQYDNTTGSASPAYNAATASIIYNGDMYNQIESGIKISKNTQLTITGTFEAFIQFDATDTLANALLLGGSATGEVRAAVVPVNEAYWGYPPYGSERIASFQTSSEYKDGGARTGQSQFGDNGRQTFTLTLQNTGTTDAWVYFTASTTAGFAQQLGYTAPIPEPQTWALMALGMMGLTAATRRQRRRFEQR